MKKRIVLYSKTGNTREIVTTISQTLQIPIQEIQATSDDPNQVEVQLVKTPSIQDADWVLIASPVHGFSIPKITKKYLSELSSLRNKTIVLLVTHHFPFAWMGGNQCLKQMRALIEQKDGNVESTICINWSSKKRLQPLTNWLSQNHLS